MQNKITAVQLTLPPPLFFFTTLCLCFCRHTGGGCWGFRWVPQSGIPLIYFLSFFPAQMYLLKHDPSQAQQQACSSLSTSATLDNVYPPIAPNVDPPVRNIFCIPNQYTQATGRCQTSMSQPMLQHSATHSIVLVPLSKGTDSASWILTWFMVIFSTDRGSERSKVRQGVAWVQGAFSTFFTQGHLACLFF